MPLLREISITLRNVLLVTVAIVLGFGIGGAVGIPGWMQGVCLIPAGCLFYRLSGKVRPPWWKMIGFTIVISILGCGYAVASSHLPERYQILSILLFLLLVPITPLMRWLERRWDKTPPTDVGTSSKAPGVRHGRLALVVAVIAMGVWFLGDLSGWQSVVMPLDAEFSLRVSRKASHPYLAEYDRRVDVLRSGQRLATLSYPRDTGGCFPMQVRFYSDKTTRVVRITDRIYDRLIDVRMGQYVEDQTPPEGKETASGVSEATLPPQLLSVQINPDMGLIQ